MWSTIHMADAANWLAGARNTKGAVYQQAAVVLTPICTHSHLYAGRLSMQQANAACQPLALLHLDVPHVVGGQARQGIHLYCFVDSSA
jgi:hypothetical protein